jgi:hypothetical protein
MQMARTLGVRAILFWRSQMAQPTQEKSIWR